MHSQSLPFFVHICNVLLYLLYKEGHHHRTHCDKYVYKHGHMLLNYDTFVHMKRWY